MKKKPQPQDVAYTTNTADTYRDTWRIFRIMSEFVEGYQLMAEIDNDVTIFGSARLGEGHEYYQIARELGGLLGKGGYATITGGGPGVMEAANRGTFEVGGRSIGLNIQLPFEQRINPYVKESLAFYYFFTRKVMLTSPSAAFIFFPGGFGTMDEFFEVIDNIEIGMICDVPIILVGHQYWQPIISFLRTSAVPKGIISEETIAKWHVVDTAQEAYQLVESGKGMKGVCELSARNFQSSNNRDWRIFRIMAELVEGFEFLTGLGNDISILGTKSLGPGDSYYESAYRLGQGAAKQGRAVLTGGIHGISEAANKGAFEAGGTSIGVAMQVRGTSALNSFLTRSITFQFPFVRKLIITAPTGAFIFYPGGLGTLHHLFEVLTLIQTGKMEKRPIFLYDHAYWGPLHAFIKSEMVHDIDTVGDEDDELYQIIDDEQTILEILAGKK